MFAIPFPNIDPALIEIGPFAIRWYALAYIAGLLIGWRYARRLAAKVPDVARPEQIDDFLVWATIGVVLGGRLGYVLFYKTAFYLEHPLAALQIWQGGMSFHGGLLGVVVAVVLYCRKHRLPVLAFGDIIFCVAPIGLFLGRVANFINGELVGRVTDQPWGVVFPGYGSEPRHASQLYQAALEGLLLFVIVNLVWRWRPARERPGTVGGVFVIGYAVFRAIGELFRQPDAHLGFLLGGLTMGQWLSAPMLLVGIGMIVFAYQKAKGP